MTRPIFSDDSGFKNSALPARRFATPGPLAKAPTPVVRAAEPTRAPQARSLTTQAHAWLARIPPRYQPLATARRYPHVINRLSELWSQPCEVAVYLNELMLSPRPQREGFAFEVLTELVDLQTLLEQGERNGH